MGAGSRGAGGIGFLSGIELFFRGALLHLAGASHPRFSSVDCLFGSFNHRRAISRQGE